MAASAKPPTTVPRPQQEAQPARPSPANPPSQPKAAPRLPPAKASTPSATTPQPPGEQLEEESPAAARPTPSPTAPPSRATTATPSQQLPQPARHTTPVLNLLPRPPRARAKAPTPPCSTTPIQPRTGARWNSSKPRTTLSASASGRWSKLSVLVGGIAVPAKPTAVLQMLVLR